MTNLINYENLALTELEKTVISKINENPLLFVNSTISQIAQYYFTSEATITRTIRHLGFENIKKFQLYLYQKIDNFNKKYTLSSQKNCNSIISNTSTFYKYTINETINNLDLKLVKNIINLIKNAKKITIFGINQNFMTGQILCSNLLAIGFSTYVTNEKCDAIKQVNILEKNKDLIFILSNSLTEPEIKKNINLAKKLNINICLITNDICKKNSIVLNYNKIHLLTYKTHPEEQKQYLYNSVKIGQMLLIDIIFNVLINAEYYLQKKLHDFFQQITLFDFENI